MGRLLEHLFVLIVILLVYLVIFGLVQRTDTIMVELSNLETRVSIIEESYINKNNIYFEENVLE